MPGRNASQRAEQRALREQMRGLGMSRAEIAAELARRYKLRPRAAWRTAWGWTLPEAADRYNALRGRGQAQPVTSLTASRLSEWENWPLSARRPPVTGLCLLAEMYQCGVLDLIDVADREKLPADQLIALGKTATTPPQSRDEDAELRRGMQTPGVTAGPVAAPAVTSQDATALGGNAHTQSGTGTVVAAFPRSLAPESPEETHVREWIVGIPGATVTPAISALNEILLGYVRADRLMGSVALTLAVRSHVAIIERLCEAARGADRIGALTFACRFMEFSGWVHQDAGDLACAMQWTDRGLDYALELGDQRIIAYTLMRKAAIATEAGLPGHGLGLTNTALADKDALTPRIRSVILRQRAIAHAMLGERAAAAGDADTAVAEAILGATQDEEDRAPYCSPMYAAMEAGAVQVRLGNPLAALPTLEKSRSTWTDPGQARDYALCLSRLATAYAAASQLEQALAAADDAMAAAGGLASYRVSSQLIRLRHILGRWGKDPVAAETVRRLTALTGPAQPVM